MQNIIRALFYCLCRPLFRLIPFMYRIFYDLANAKFFDQDLIKSFSSNLYVLLSVVMLFALAVKALASIVNPDLLFDSKKGFTGVLKRALIALLLIVGIPFAFSKFYEYQEQIMSKSLIEKIILGANIQGDDTNIAGASGAGQMLAGLTLSSVLYIPEDTVAYDDLQDVVDKYDRAVGEDIDYLKNFSASKKNLNVKSGKDDDDDGEENYLFEFRYLEALIVCIAEIYLLGLFCLDTAERAIRLAFLQLTAPISVIAYVYGGNDILKNWGKETGKTGFAVFLRIAGLAFLILVLSRLTSFTDNIQAEGFFYSKLIGLLLIVGTLMFIKELPKAIEKMFGVSIGGKGGIKGRLGNMAGADVAKKALGTLGKAATIGATGLGLGALALGKKGLGFAGDALKKSEVANKLKEAGKNKADEFATKHPNITKRAGDVASVVKRTPAGLSALKKGIEAGGGKKGYTAMSEAYASSATAKLDRIKRDKDYAKAHNIVDGVLVGSEEDRKNNVSGMKARAKNSADFEKNSVNTGSQKKATADKMKSDTRVSQATQFKDTIDKIVSNLETEASLAKQSGDTVTGKNIDDLVAKFKAGEISSNDFESTLKKIANEGAYKMASSSVNKVIGGLNDLEGMVLNDSVLRADLMNSGELKFDDENNKTIETARFTARAAEKALDMANDSAKSIDDVYQTRYDSADVKQKEEMDRYVNGNEIINKQYAKDTQKYRENGADPRHSKVSDVELVTPTPTSSNVVHETLQQGIDRAANVHDAPTREEHNDRYQDLVSTFGTDYGNSPASNPTQQQASTPTPAQAPDTSQTQSTPTAAPTQASGSTETVVNANMPDLSSYFSGLESTIQSTAADTNEILNRQLKEQKGINQNTKTANDKLDGISNGIKEVNRSVNNVAKSIDNYSTTINSNLEDINQNIKKDDNE